jgi:endo-1,4-beta-xylanase
MKFNKILPIIALSSLFMTSCDDMMMEWGKDPSHGEVTTAELPLQLAEQISRYDVLRNYTDFKLGAGIGLDLYMKDETYRNIVNANFDEVTIGYEMKHGPMVKSNGSIDFSNVDAFIAQTKAAGLTVYGHTLCWHQNQNASYLNGLIAPTVIPGASGSNSLDLSGLKDASFTGWNRSNPGAGITVVAGAGLSSTSQAVKLIAGASAASPWNLQLTTPNITIVAGHNYELSFYIKSEEPGKGRISFSNDLTNQYPWKDWYATGGSYTEAFETTSQWQQVKIPIASSDFAAGKTSFNFNFDLGYLPNVTYYIDVNNIMVVDKDAVPTFVNLISNDDFDGGTLSPWGGWGNSSTRTVSPAGEGYGGTGYAMVLTNPTAANTYSAQAVYTFSAPLEQGVEYTCSFMVKAATAAKLQFQIQGAGYNADYYGGIDVGTTWTPVQRKVTPTKGDRDKFIFDFGEYANTYYIDDIVFTSGEVESGTGPTIVEKTDEEKKQIISDALADWISQMVTHYKNDVFAWDVVNEPMRENGTLRDGNVSELASDEFYWVKYMGQDFAVQAFKWARQYGNASDKLFINDYNLEANLDKCDGLINYTQYIESQGATVDGIGTQMHISLNTDTVKIVQMFQKMAATGKLVKVTELDVRLGTKDPTQEQLAKQAEIA